MRTVASICGRFWLLLGDILSAVGFRQPCCGFSPAEHIAMQSLDLAYRYERKN